MANKYGIKVISKVNLMIAPIIFVSILVIVISTSENFVIQRLLPIFGYGINETFFGSITNVFGFTGLAYLLYLQPLLKNEKDLKKISILSMIISGIYLLLSVISLLFIYNR